MITTQQFMEEIEMRKSEILNNCPLCKVKGKLPHDACPECRKKFHLHVERHFSGLDDLLWKSTLESLPEEGPVKAQVQDYVLNLRENKKTGKGLILYDSRSRYGIETLNSGPTEINHTPALAVILIAAAVRYNIKFIEVDAFRRLINKEYKFDRQSEEEGKLSASLMNAEFCAFDGLNECFSRRSYMKGKLLELLYHRRMYSYPTLVTTDIESESEFKNFYGSELHRLITEENCNRIS